MRTAGLRTRLMALAVLACCGLASGSLHADDATSRYFQGLRDRQLYSLAEGYAIEQIQRPRTPLAIRTAWTIELSRTFAEHAQHVSGDEQESLWKRALQVIKELESSEPDNLRRVFLQTQAALLLAARGRFSAAAAELDPDDVSAHSQAEKSLQEAIVALKDSERSISKAAAALKGRTNSEDLSVSELRSLQDTLKFTLIETLVARAQRLPKTDPERASSLLDAESLARPLAGGIPGEIATLNARWLLAEIARLKGDAKQAAAAIAALEKETLPATMEDRLVAVQVRSMLDASLPDEALKRLLQYQKKRFPLPGELQYLKTASLLALWAIADRNKSTDLAGELWNELKNQVENAEKDSPGWWSLRGRTAFDRAREDQSLGGELGTLARKAKAAWTAGRTDEAIGLYGEAAALAAREEKTSAAVEFGLTRGSLLLQSNRFAEAAEDFRAIVDKYPKDAKAADADLLAAHCLGRLYDSERTAERREAYQDALESHRQRFPDSPTFGEATWRLAVFLERRLQWTQAVPLYAEIPRDHPRYPEAAVSIARCWESILHRVHELNEPAAEWEARAIRQLDPLVEAFPESPQPLDRPAAEVAVRFARILLEKSQPAFAKADSLLERATDSSTQARTKPAEPSASEPNREAELSAWDALRRTAIQLRILSLAGQKKWDQAEKLLRELSAAGISEGLSVLSGLSEFSRTTDAATRRGLGELQLKIVGLLEKRRAELSDEAIDQLQRCHAEALAATNQPRAAIPVYEAILAKTPSDTAIRRTLAQLLILCGDKECLKKAQSHWKTLESQAKPGTAEFFEARYHLALCAFQQGHVEECRKLLGVTRLLYPNRGGGEWAKRFDELERKLPAKQNL